MKDFDMDFDVEFEVDSEDGLGWTEKYRVLSEAYRWRSMSTDSDFTSTVSGLMSDELACCILQATLEGRESLVRGMIELRGPVPIVYEKGRDEHDIATVNGVEFAYSRFDKLKGIERVAELRSLYKMIHEFGMKGIIEPGETFPLLCQDRVSVFNEDKIPAFEGELPYLDAGVLKQPELVIALLGESEGSVMPAAYQPVLCWATAAMVNEFPGQLAPLTPFQEVAQHGSLAKWKNKTDDYRQMDFQTIVTGVRPSEYSTSIAGAVFRHMGPESARFGFDNEQGRVLCETTVSFLLGFETGPSDMANVTAAQHFVDAYFPLDIISAQVTQECVERFGHDVKLRELSSSMQTNHAGGFNDVFGLLAKDHPLRDLAISMMPREMWHKLALKKKGDQLTAQSMVALYDAFGIDNAGMSLSLYASKIRDLFGTGYRFSDQTEVFDTIEDEDHLTFYDDDQVYEEQPSPTTVAMSYESTDFVSNIVQSNDDIRRQMLGGYMEMIKLNLWPVSDEKPTDIGHALQMSVLENFSRSENKVVMSLKAYLMLAGVEACCRAATEPAHWKRLAETFSSDELTAYLHLMPNQAKGQLLDDVLGL